MQGMTRDDRGQESDCGEPRRTRIRPLFNVNISSENTYSQFALIPMGM